MITSTALHSVSYAGFWGQPALNVRDFIDKAAALGFDGVMLMAKRPHVSVLDYADRQRLELRSHLERAGLRAACIAGYTNFTADLEHRDIPTLEMQIAHVIELARLAHSLDCGLVRVFTGYEHASISFDAAWNLIAGALGECARACAGLGVTIGVQNHHDIAVDFESIADLINEVGEPNCRAMFDAWAPAIQGRDAIEAARKMGRLTVHTTIANYQPRERFLYQPAIVNYQAATPRQLAVPIDEGAIDYAAYLDALIGGGFSGSVAYEMCSRLRDGASMNTLDDYARRFVRFVAEYKRMLERSAITATP